MGTPLAVSPNRNTNSNRRLLDLPDGSISGMRTESAIGDSITTGTGRMVVYSTRIHC